MTTAESDDTHVQLKLGLYVLGGLTPTELSAVENHLATCAACNAEAIELCEVREFLDVLTTEDVDAIADGDRHRIIREAVTTSGWPRSTSPGNTAGPGPGNLGPDGGAKHRRPISRSRLVAGAIALALVVGIGLGAWLKPDTAMEVTLAGSETNSATGNSMSVTAVGTASSSHVEASITGLEPGVVYQLYAVSSRGDTQVVIRWIGASPDETVAADSPIRATDLAFVTLTRGDGGVLVTVRVARSAGTT